MTLKPSKVLMAAADLLEKGWCQPYLARGYARTLVVVTPIGS